MIWPERQNYLRLGHVFEKQMPSRANSTSCVSSGRANAGNTFVPHARKGRKPHVYPWLEPSCFPSLGESPWGSQVSPGCGSFAECPGLHRESPPECRNFSCITLTYGTFDSTSTCLAQKILKSVTCF